MRLRARERQSFGSIFGIIVSVVIGLFLAVKICRSGSSVLSAVTFAIVIFMTWVSFLFFFTLKLTTETEFEEKLRKQQEEEVERLKKRSRLK